MSNNNVFCVNNSRGRGRGRGRGGFRPKRNVLSDIAVNKLSCLNAKVSPTVEMNTNELAAKFNFEPISDLTQRDNSDDEDERCDFCGLTEHRSRFCTIFNNVRKPSLNGSCFYCKEEGHFKINCPKKLSQRNKVNKNSIDGNNRTKKDNTKTYSYRSSNSTTEPDYDSHSWATVNASQPSKAPHKRIHVPMPVPASTIKPVIQLRSQLKSVESANTSYSNKNCRMQSLRYDKFNSLRCRSDSNESVTDSSSDSTNEKNKFSNGCKIVSKDKSKIFTEEINFTNEKSSSQRSCSLSSKSDSEQLDEKIKELLSPEICLEISTDSEQCDKNFKIDSDDDLYGRHGALLEVTDDIEKQMKTFDFSSSLSSSSVSLTSSSSYANSSIDETKNLDDTIQQKSAD